MTPSVMAVLARLFVAVGPGPGDDWDAEPPPVAEVGVAIEGRAIASLFQIDTLTVEAMPPDPAAPVEIGDGPSIRIAAELAHDLDATVVTAELAVALLPAADHEFVWTRLHTPPLQQRAVDLRRKFPHALTIVAPGGEEPWSTGTARDFAAREAADGLPASPTTLRWIATIQNLVIESPSGRDVERILAGGGPNELAALAHWATERFEEKPFDEPTCRTLMGLVEGSIRRLRAPPAFGDFQRLNALATIAVLCGGPADLERSLELQRPMTILLSSAELSHSSAVAEEGALGIAVHGFGQVQARSAAGVAWDTMLTRLRITALDRLLRLAAEPADFRGAEIAPLRRAPLRVAANALLAPLQATEVERALSLTTDRPDTQREILRFYVDMRHVPAVEPLVDWLTAHPIHVDDLGTYAVGAMGDAMLGSLVRRFDDPDASSSERAATWRLLAMLPDRQAATLAAVVAPNGVDLSGLGAEPTTAQVLRRLMEHDRALQEERIERLVDEITADTPSEVVIQARAAVRLAELDPARAAEIGEAIIRVHVAAARALDEDAPVERQAMLAQLVELPLGTSSRSAARASATTGAELAIHRGELRLAFELLERHDPGLVDEEVRAVYERALRLEWEQAFAAGDWAAAESVIARADASLPDVIDTAQWQATLDHRRALPLRILGWSLGGALVIIAAYALHALGVVAAIRRRRAARDARRAELARQWEPDAPAAAATAVASSGDDMHLLAGEGPDDRGPTVVVDDAEAIADSWSAPADDAADDLAHDPVGDPVDPIDDYDESSPLDDFAA